MKFKKSFYNFEIESLENGDKLFYNSYTNTFGIMNKFCYEVYSNIENKNESNITELEMKEIKTMKQFGFIVDNEFDELKNFIYKRRCSQCNNKSFLNVTIAPTMDCNMCCPYCFEKKNKKVMDSKTQELLIDFIKNNLEEVKFLKITWFGGEPLLQKDVIRNISKQLIEICKEKNIKYRSVIITNGVLLDEETAKILKEECKIEGAQITLDGIGKTNNERRKLKNGLESFPIIIKNIVDASKYMFSSVRVNIDKNNIDECDKIMDYFSEILKDNKNIEYYFSQVSEYTDANKNIKSSCYSDEEFNDVYIEIMKKMYARNNINYIKSIYPKQMYIHCGAETLNNYVIDPEGFIYKCVATLGIEDEKIGNILDGIDPNKLSSKHVQWITTDIPKKCTQCNVMPLCLGGCPSRIKQNLNNAICNPRYKEKGMKELFKIIYELYHKSKNEKLA